MNIKILFLSIVTLTSSLFSGPHFFKSLEDIAQALEKNPGRITYLAIGSANPAGKHNNYGYAQSLPLFAEHFFNNKDLADQVRIILVDTTWKDLPYEKSDIARYLKEHKNRELVKKIEDSIFIVADELNENNFSLHTDPLVTVLKKDILKNKNALIIGTFYWHTRNFFENAIGDLFFTPMSSRKFIKEKRLHYFYWPEPNSLAYIDNKEEAVSVWWCDTEVLNYMDQFIITNNTKSLHDLISILSSDNNELSEQRRTFFSNLTQASRQFFLNNIKNRVKEFQQFLKYNIHVSGFSKDEVSKIVMHFHEDDIFKGPKNYSLFSLVPTQNLPLIDFKAELKNNVLTMNPTVTVENNQFDFLNLKPYLELPAIKKNYEKFLLTSKEKQK